MSTIRWVYAIPRTERRHTGISFRQQKRRRTETMRMVRKLNRVAKAAGELAESFEHTAAAAKRLGLAFLEAKLEPGPIPNLGTRRPMRREDFER